MLETYPFKLMPLNYNSLEPFIDNETLMLHHDKHLKKYVDTLNETIKPYDNLHNYTIEKLILDNDTLPEEIRVTVKNNAGGVYNHNLYFDMMTPNETVVFGNLKNKIEEVFGSLDNFYNKLKDESLKVFGSGYAWLVVGKDKNLKIIHSSNQDVPLNVIPVILVDVWEHSYYLKYKNRRAEYYTNWFKLIDFKKAEENYNFAMNYLQN